MKKPLLFLLFMVVGVQSGWAQVQVMLLRDTMRYQISRIALDKKYASLLNARPQGAQAAMQTRWKQMGEFMKSRTDIPQRGFSLFVHEYYQPDGKAQYVLIDTDRPHSDSVLAHAMQVLTDFYSSTPYPITASMPFRIMSVMTYGKTFMSPRTVRRGPGIISTLEAAQKTTRPDTVTKLAFNQLDLKNVPNIVYQFPNLEELDLSKNALSQLPARLTAEIPALKRLSLLGNDIPDDSVFITFNNHLLALNLQSNKLTRVPPSVRHNRRLESLWLGNNNLTSLDMRTLSRLRWLTDLNLYNAGLTTLPNTIGRLKRVKVLDLYHNKFKELPRKVGRLKHLEQLAVAYNDLSQLPASLAKLRSLQTLYAHHNRISQLPIEFTKLNHLRILDLGYNWFSVAPAVVMSLPALEELDLNNNNIQELPASLGTLKSLKKLYLRSNPLTRDNATAGPYAPIIRQLEANKTEVFY